MGDLFDSLGRVVWFSSKVTDGAPLRDICNLRAAFSLLGAADRIAPGLAGWCLEDASGERWDYDTRSFDDLGVQHQIRIVETIQELAAQGPTTIIPFFAYRLTTSIALSTPNVRLLGNPPDLERMFDQKPWVEDRLSRLGVRTVHWQHFRKSAMQRPQMAFPIVVRPPSGTGGLGMYLVPDIEALAALLADPSTPELLSAAAYLSEAVSVNVTGCVHADGTVSSHPVSLQVIGAQACTSRTFGYCGNDFGRVPQVLNFGHLAQIDQLLGTVGCWLHGYGFRGAFGLDLMVKGGDVIVSELNPRFQGSSHLGALIMREAGAEDVYVQHIRSHLGLQPIAAGPSLTDIAAGQPGLAQLFCYSTPRNEQCGGVAVDAEPDPAELLEFVPSPSTCLDDHALLFRMVTRMPVLDTGGRDLLPAVSQRLQVVRSEISERKLVPQAAND